MTLINVINHFNPANLNSAVMNSKDSPRSALTDRFFRLEGLRDGCDVSISTKKDVFSKTSSFVDDPNSLSPNRSSVAVLIDPFPNRSLCQENWGLEADERSYFQFSSSNSPTPSPAAAELYLSTVPIYNESIEGEESKNIILLDLSYNASVIQKAARRFLATRDVIRLRMFHLRYRMVQNQHSAAVKIQNAFRLWYRRTLFRIRTLQNRLEQAQQDTKDSLRVIAKEKHREMQDYQHSMGREVEKRFRRGERYLSKMEKLSENLRAENELILILNEELVVNNETEFKCQKDLRRESMTLQRDSTLIRSNLKHLLRKHKTLKTSSNVLMKRIDEFQEVMYRVKAFSALEAKITAVTTDGIYKTLAFVRESCTDKELANDIVADGMKGLKSDFEYAKLRIETTRHKKLQNSICEHRKMGKHSKADVDAIDSETAKKTKHKTSIKASAKVEKNIAHQKMHVRFVFAV